MADNSARIAEIQEILRTGASRVSKDGVTVDYQLDVLRAELRKLQGTDDSQKGRRPIVSRINLDA